MKACRFEATGASQSLNLCVHTRERGGGGVVLRHSCRSLNIPNAEFMSRQKKSPNLNTGQVWSQLRSLLCQTGVNGDFGGLEGQGDFVNGRDLP